MACHQLQAVKISCWKWKVVLRFGLLLWIHIESQIMSWCWLLSNVSERWSAAPGRCYKGVCTATWGRLLQQVLHVIRHIPSSASLCHIPTLCAAASVSFMRWVVAKKEFILLSHLSKSEDNILQHIIDDPLNFSNYFLL